MTDCLSLPGCLLFTLVCFLSFVFVCCCLSPKLFCVHVITAFAASARRVLSPNKACLSFTSYSLTLSVVFTIITMGILLFQKEILLMDETF